MKKFYENKIFIIVSLFLIFGAVAVVASTIGDSGYSGIQVDNYFSGSGKQGITQDIAFIDNDGNNHSLSFEDGLLVNYDFSEFIARESITITENSNSTLTDYPVLLNVTFNSYMDGDFSNIRFFDGSGNKLSYYVENQSDGNWASVWVKVLSLPASQNTVIYLYYNETGVSSESDAFSVFAFYDDFSSANTTKWQANTGSLSVSGGEAVVNNDMLVGDVAVGYGYMFEYEGRGWGDGTGMQSPDNRSGTGTPDLIFAGSNCNGLAFYTLDNGTSSGSGGCPFGSLPSDEDVLGAFRVNSSAVEFYKNGILESTITSIVPDSDLYFGMRSWTSQTTYFDWVRIRKLVSDEPTVTYS